MTAIKAHYQRRREARPRGRPGESRKTGHGCSARAYTKFTALDVLPKAGRLPDSIDSYCRAELRRMARARQRSLAGKDATARQRYTPVDQVGVIPPAEFVYVAQPFLGIALIVAATCRCAAERRTLTPAGHASD